MREVVAATAAIAAIALAGISAWYFTNPSATSFGTTESIIIGNLP